MPSSPPRLTVNVTVTLAKALLDTHAGAALLRVEPDTVYSWARSGEFPCLRLGPRCLRGTRPLLEEWLAERLDNGRQ